jgi:hypothetical protein
MANLFDFLFLSSDIQRAGPVSCAVHESTYEEPAQQAHLVSFRMLASCDAEVLAGCCFRQGTVNTASFLSFSQKVPFLGPPMPWHPARRRRPFARPVNVRPGSPHTCYVRRARSALLNALRADQTGGPESELSECAHCVDSLIKLQESLSLRPPNDPK